MIRLLLLTLLSAFFLSSASQVSQTCNVLALSGGGAFGAIEVGILDSLTATHTIPNKFDIVTGISAGGLNAGFLSYYDNITSAAPVLRSIYSTLTTDDVYNSDYLGILSRWAVYDNSPLEKTLTTILKTTTQSANPPITLIGASNLYTAELDIYRFNTLSLEDKIDVLMSTSSIPFIFPPRKYNNTLYVDGGLISNEIINQAIGELPCEFYNITFISASSKTEQKPDITGLFSYISTVVHVLFKTFDYQLAQITRCSYPKGLINACFPTSSLLSKYSILDFDNGAILYNLGMEAHKCIQYELC